VSFGGAIYTDTRPGSYDDYVIAKLQLGLTPQLSEQVEGCKQSLTWFDRAALRLLLKRAQGLPEMRRSNRTAFQLYLHPHNQVSLTQCITMTL
jgi:hypothetical protein